MNELFVCLSAIFPSENKTMDLKLISKYIYKSIFENVAIWKNIWNSLCIYFLFSSQSASFWWAKKIYISLIYIYIYIYIYSAIYIYIYIYIYVYIYTYIYIQIWKVFKNSYLHIFIEPKETQSCKQGLKQVRICLDKQVSS